MNNEHLKSETQWYIVDADKHEFSYSTREEAAKLYLDALYGMLFSGEGEDE